MYSELNCNHPAEVVVNRLDDAGKRHDAGLLSSTCPIQSAWQPLWVLHMNGT
jgi:hypothetical protein